MPHHSVLPCTSKLSYDWCSLPLFAFARSVTSLPNGRRPPNTQANLRQPRVYASPTRTGTAHTHTQRCAHTHTHTHTHSRTHYHTHTHAHTHTHKHPHTQSHTHTHTHTIIH